MSELQANTSDITAFPDEPSESHQSETQTALNASYVSDSATSETQQKLKDRVAAMLKAKFKVVDICEQLGVSQAYVYRVKKAVPKKIPVVAAEKFEEENPELFSSKLSLTAQNTARTKKRLIEEMFKHKGVLTNAVRAVGCSFQTYYVYMKEDENFRARIEEVKEAAIDFVEDKLFQQIEMNIPQSTIFFLRTRGRHRGYSERTEVTGAEGAPIEIRVIEPYIDVLADVSDAEPMEADYKVIEPS